MQAKGSCRLLGDLGTTHAAGLAGGLELGVALGPDRLGAAGEGVGRGDVPDGAVETDGVVVLDPAADEGAGLVEGVGLAGSDRVGLDGLVPALDLAVGLRVVRRGPHVGHAGEADELLEVLGDELRAIVGDDARPLGGEHLASAQQDALNVDLGHRLADLPVHDGPAGAVEDRAQVVERSAQVEVGNVDVPVLMGPQGLDEASPLLRGLGVPAVEDAGGGEDTVDARRAGGDDLLVEHHEGQPAVSLEREPVVEVEDGLLLVRQEPVVAWDQGIVLVGLAVALAPVEELAAADADPGDEPVGGNLGLRRPVANEVDDVVARVMGNPATRQGSPRSFFSWVYSAAISAMTPSFLASLVLSWTTSAASSFSRLLGPVAAGGARAPARLARAWRCHW